MHEFFFCFFLLRHIHIPVYGILCLRLDRPLHANAVQRERQSRYKVHMWCDHPIKASLVLALSLENVSHMPNSLHFISSSLLVSYLLAGVEILSCFRQLHFASMAFLPFLLLLKTLDERDFILPSQRSQGRMEGLVVCLIMVECLIKESSNSF